MQIAWRCSSRGEEVGSAFIQLVHNRLVTHRAFEIRIGGLSIVRFRANNGLFGSYFNFLLANPFVTGYAGRRPFTIAAGGP